MKGAVGYFASKRASEAALQLQSIGMRDELGRARQALDELEQALEKLTPALAAYVEQYA
jgi:hypothetical protein